MKMTFPELRERPRAALEAMETGDEVQRAYDEATRHYAPHIRLALERRPFPQKGDDDHTLYVKALYRKLASFSGVSYEKDGTLHYQV